MCFSASASFGAGIVLSAVGIASVKKAQTPSQVIFASIPLMFAVQQITEGFLWLSLTNPSYAALQEVTTYNFLFFAQVVWPIWTPLGVYKLDPEKKRRTIGKVLIGIGALVSAYLLYCLVTYHVEAKLIGYHISYQQDYPISPGRYGTLLYVVATIVPPFFSRVKHMWMLGAAISISYIITAILYTDYVVSVWCFFASIISIAIYIIMKENKKITEVREALSQPV